jgi:hypothetical protein
MCSRNTRKTGCHCLQQAIRDSFAIAIRGLFAWLPLSICMKVVLRRLSISLISDFQGVYYQVRQLQNVQQPAAQTMDPIKITLIAFLCGLFCSCSTGNPPKLDNSNWAIDTCSPGQYEIARAEERAKNWWSKNSARYGNEPHYLAIDTTKLLDGEIVQDLWPKLVGSPHTTSFFAGNAGEYNQGSIYCVMIFDTNTGKLVSTQGYAFVDTPAKGQVVRFGNYVARFIR